MGSHQTYCCNTATLIIIQSQNVSLQTRLHVANAGTAVGSRSASLIVTSNKSCFWVYFPNQTHILSTHLWEHGQFFGKVDDTGDGRSDDLSELAEGLQVHLVSVRRGRNRGLADLVWLHGEIKRGWLIREQSKNKIRLDEQKESHLIRGLATFVFVNKSHEKTKKQQQWTDN